MLRPALAVFTAAATLACSRPRPPPSADGAAPVQTVSAPLAADAAASSSDAPRATDCKLDADCALLNAAPPRCCSRCGSDAVTKAAADRAGAECAQIMKGRSDYFASCPHISCPCMKEKAVCKAGSCERVVGPCGG